MVSLSEEQTVEVNESDCCGNGCANCILDVKTFTTKKSDNYGKKNIILNYCKYKLQSRVYYDPHDQSDILDLHFICADVSKTADHILDIPPGHHIMMRAPIGDAAENIETKYILRPYSPYWVDATNLEFKILVNLKPNGPMSQIIRDGDEVEFRGPIGNFQHTVVDGDPQRSLIIITQGVAIAPTLPLVEEVLANDEDLCRIFHFACFRDLDHIIFRDRLHEFNKYWNFKGRIYLSRQNCGSAACEEWGCSDHCEFFRSKLRYKELVHPRRLDATEFEDAFRCMGASEPTFIVCGTRDFQNRMVESIKATEIGCKNENIILF